MWLKNEHYSFINGIKQTIFYPLMFYATLWNVMEQKLFVGQMG